MKAQLSLTGTLAMRALGRLLDLGLSAEEVGSLVGATGRTVARWRAGESEASGVHADLLQLLDAFAARSTPARDEATSKLCESWASRFLGRMVAEGGLVAVVRRALAESEPR